MYLQTLSAEFKKNNNPQNAFHQKAYMKNQFEFFGLKTTLRREVQKPFLSKDFLPPKKDLLLIIKELWNKPEREFQLFGQELVFKYTGQFEQEDMTLLEFMVTHKSWWDTVDFIAANLMGAFLRQFPELQKPFSQKWTQSGHLWLMRSAILFQLKYKKDTDTKLLSEIIQSQLGSKEFFINKAIGWALREYSKTNPDWVREFVDKTPLHGLSRREAIRLLP